MAARRARTTCPLTGAHPRSTCAPPPAPPAPAHPHTRTPAQARTLARSHPAHPRSHARTFAGVPDQGGPDHILPHRVRGSLRGARLDVLAEGVEDVPACTQHARGEASSKQSHNAQASKQRLRDGDWAHHRIARTNQLQQVQCGPQVTVKSSMPHGACGVASETRKNRSKITTMSKLPYPRGARGCPRALKPENGR